LRQEQKKQRRHDTKQQQKKDSSFQATDLEGKLGLICNSIIIDRIGVLEGEMLSSASILASQVGSDNPFFTGLVEILKVKIKYAMDSLTVLHKIMTQEQKKYVVECLYAIVRTLKGKSLNELADDIKRKAIQFYNL
jgi:hypothetical protein